MKNERKREMEINYKKVRNNGKENEKKQNAEEETRNTKKRRRLCVCQHCRDDLFSD
jgi:hypothetical protein